jgi:hypothetical protein
LNQYCRKAWPAIEKILTGRKWFASLQGEQSSTVVGKLSRHFLSVTTMIHTLPHDGRPQSLICMAV